MPDELFSFNRATEAGVRLYLQHWMCTYQTGFLLHPDIPTNREDLKVADVACGTGIWLVDLARNLPKSAQLDGFDISTAHFPPKQWLPENVNLSVLDALAPVPEHLVGNYDVVHVGRIVLFIQNENPSQLLNNFISLLKPGGFLFWEELDMSTMHASPADPSMPHPHYDKMHIQGGKWLMARGRSSQWVGDMDNVFLKHGLQVVDQKRLPIGNQMAKPWTDMQIMAYQDFIEHDVIPSCIDQDSSSPTPMEWREMLRNVIAECQQGLSITMDMTYVLGRKVE